MKTVWKYQIVPGNGGEALIEMPAGAMIRGVQYVPDTDEVCLWAEVRPNAPRELRRISVFGTGLPIPERKRTYLGTVQAGGSVWHIYETLEA